MADANLVWEKNIAAWLADDVMGSTEDRSSSFAGKKIVSEVLHSSYQKGPFSELEPLWWQYFTNW